MNIITGEFCYIPMSSGSASQASRGPRGPARRGRTQGGYPTVGAQYPELIYTSVTCYGKVGPLAERPGYEALLNARLGQTAEQRGHRDGPIFLGHPTVSYGTAFMTAIGILSALRARSGGVRNDRAGGEWKYVTSRSRIPRARSRPSRLPRFAARV